ncbi:aldo/keto reductase [Tenacibaculum maritimum]|uniref:aldo/keto reductase n=1 Tax=Tenacibaculum maritimum TaxID=107401 RepID=UPI0038774DE3
MEFSKFFKQKKTIKINDSFYYSIEKDFLELQIQASLKKLNTNYLDCFLIHNPEHYFDVHNENQSKIYEHIVKSLYHLETLVKKGIIRYYGISSNILPTRGIDLTKILENNNFPNFKLIQFPYNLIEKEASLKNYGNESLIELCKRKDIKTITNRPLNTTYNNKALRLADYTHEISKIDDSEEERLFSFFIEKIQNQLIKFGEDSKPEDFTPIKYFIENRKIIANPEALSKGVESHLIPFINQLQFDKKDVIFKITKHLQYHWSLYSKASITQRASNLKKELVINGVFNKEDKRDISLMACENYLSQGINHVLVGMRKKEYVEKLLPLI